MARSVKKVVEAVSTTTTDAAIAAAAAIVATAPSAAVVVAREEPTTAVGTVSGTLRQLMIEAVTISQIVDSGIKTAQAAKGKGVYSVLTACAASDPQLFGGVWERLKADLQLDADGVAVKAGLKIGKKGRYLIPASAMTAASKLTSAIELGVALTDADATVKTYSAIQADLKTAQDILRQKGADAVEKVLYALSKATAVLNGTLLSLSGPLRDGEVRVSARIDHFTHKAMVTALDATTELLEMVNPD